MTQLQIVSVELTNVCSKGCWFCYNHSHPLGETTWDIDEVVSFARDLARCGVRAMSFGGGEPLQYEGLFEILEELHGMIYRSLTTNGLLLDAVMLDRLVEAAPNKVHVSLHFPESLREVQRVVDNVEALRACGIQSGVNLVVRKSRLKEAQRAVDQLRNAGIDNDRIIYLPMRGQDTPSPNEIHVVAGRKSFQSMSCLTDCGNNPRFAAVDWNKNVAWCSYTKTRVELLDLSYEGLCKALNGLGVEFCGNDALTELRA